MGDVGVGSIGLFAGCFGSDNDGQRSSNGGDTDVGDETDDGIGDGIITIVTDYRSDPWERYWATLTAEFEAETGVTVDREAVGFQRAGDPRLEGQRLPEAQQRRLRGGVGDLSEAASR